MSVREKRVREGTQIGQTVRRDLPVGRQRNESATGHKDTKMSWKSRNRRDRSGWTGDR